MEVYAKTLSKVSINQSQYLKDRISYSTQYKSSTKAGNYGLIQIQQIDALSPIDQKQLLTKDPHNAQSYNQSEYGLP